MSEKKQQVANAVQSGRALHAEILKLVDGKELRDECVSQVDKAKKSLEKLEAMDGGEAVKGAEGLVAVITNAHEALKNALQAKNDEESSNTEPPQKVFRMAPGKSLTTARGILADGDEIFPGDLPADSFDRFVKSGHIRSGK